MNWVRSSGRLLTATFAITAGCALLDLTSDRPFNRQVRAEDFLSLWFLISLFVGLGIILTNAASRLLVKSGAFNEGLGTRLFTAAVVGALLIAWLSPWIGAVLGVVAILVWTKLAPR